MAYLGAQTSTVPYSNNRVQAFSGNAYDNQFTLAHGVSGKHDLEVLVDGVQLSPFDGSYNVTNGTTLTLTQTPSSGTNNITIYYRGMTQGVYVPVTNSVSSHHLVPTGVSAGAYGGATSIPVITVDVSGRVTNVTTSSVSGITGAGWSSSNNTLTVNTSTSSYSANISQFDDPVTFADTITTRSLLPSANVTYDIGSSTMRYRDVYLSNSTIYLGNSTITETGGSLSISNAGAPAVNLATVAQASDLAATAYSNAVSAAATDASTKAATAYTNAMARAATNTYVNSTFAPLAGASFTGNIQVGGSATISGNLIVNGTTITVNTSQINVTDSLMYLASNNESSDSLDIGFAAHYNNGSGANGHTGFIRSALTKKYYLFQNYQPEFFANNNVDVSNTSTGIQMADLVVGNLASNGALTVTGQATFSNTVAVTGTSTFSGLITGTITSANNADYLDGQHGAYYAANSQLASYALLSGATFTGAVAVSNSISVANLTTTTNTVTVGTAAYVVSNGNVGIGNSSPTHKLSVSGSIYAGTPFIENPNIVTADYTIAANTNAMSAGPITVANGVTVTISNNSVWTIV